MCFNPVADAWWEEKPRIVDCASFEPRKRAGLKHTYFAAYGPHWKKSRTLGKSPAQFSHHLCIVG